jgi:hypothetical protein
MKRIIGRESRVNSASRFNESALASHRCRMTFANASHTGPSAVRGKGLLSMLKLFEKFDEMD